MPRYALGRQWGRVNLLRRLARRHYEGAAVCWRRVARLTARLCVLFNPLLSHISQHHVFCLQACPGHGFAALLGKVPRSDLRSALLERLLLQSARPSPLLLLSQNFVHPMLVRAQDSQPGSTFFPRNTGPIPYPMTPPHPTAYLNPIISWPWTPLSVRRNQSTRCPSIAPSHSCGSFLSLRVCTVRLP